MCHALAFALLCVLPRISDDLAEHQGTWQVVSYVYDGEATPEEIIQTITRTVEGDHIVWRRNGKAFAGTTFTINSKAEPKTLDVIPDGGPNRDQKVLGIYKIEGDMLTILMAAPDQPRPTTFAVGSSEKQTGMTFRRVKDPEKVKRTPRD